MIERIMLQSWQIIKIIWIWKYENKILNNDILNDDCELNKIIQMLMLIHAVLKIVIVFHWFMFILFSSAIVNTWINEIHIWFSDMFHFKLFYDDFDEEKTSNLIWKKYMINFKKWIEIVEKLSLNNFEISRMIILSFYLIWCF